MAKVSNDPKLTAQAKPALCTQNTFTVHVTAVGYDAPVCALSVNGKPILYLFEIKASGQYYLGEIIYEHPAYHTQQEAQAIVDSIDLRNSNDDIKKIIASIKPLN